jgi:hypothetical protein
LERWLKEVNASNALPTGGGCNALNGRFDCSGTEISEVGQPQSAVYAIDAAVAGRRAAGIDEFCGAGSSEYRWRMPFSSNE